MIILIVNSTLNVKLLVEGVFIYVLVTSVFKTISVFHPCIQPDSVHAQPVKKKSS